jgi:hypothetical protein
MNADQLFKKDMDENYPSYEESGNGKPWEEMTDLEKANYKIRKLYNALAVSRNHIKFLRKRLKEKENEVR